MEQFSKKEVTRITGVLPRNVQYLTDRGLVVPEIDSGEGRGKSRLYSKKNLVEFSILKVLGDYGMAFPKIKTLLSEIRGTAAFFRKDGTAVEFSELRPDIREMLNRSWADVGTDPLNLLDHWAEITEPCFLIVFTNEHGEFHTQYVLGKADWNRFSELFRQRASVLMINLTSILDRIREI